MYRTTGSKLFNPYNLALLAETFLTLDRPEEALAHIDDALADGRKREVGFYDAELQRMRGDVLASLNVAGDDVEACYDRAIEVAVRQGARSLHLRATTNLCRILAEKGQRARAQELLSPLLTWFSDGFETADLREAKNLIGELS